MHMQPVVTMCRMDALNSSPIMQLIVRRTTTLVFDTTYTERIRQKPEFVLMIRGTLFE